jgi:hypothetical protein
VKFNPRQLLHAIGAPREIVDAIDGDTLAALRGVKIDPVEIGEGKNKKIVYRVEVKFPEKTAAREQAMKHFGLYERDNKQSRSTCRLSTSSSACLGAAAIGDGGRSAQAAASRERAPARLGTGE